MVSPIYCHRTYVYTSVLYTATVGMCTSVLYTATVRMCTRKSYILPPYVCLHHKGSRCRLLSVQIDSSSCQHTVAVHRMYSHSVLTDVWMHKISPSWMVTINIFLNNNVHRRLNGPLPLGMSAFTCDNAVYVFR